MQQPFSLTEAFAGLREYWKPLALTHGDFGFRLVRFAGDFEWHRHPESDKAILVMEGEMGIRFDDGSAPVTIKAGELYVLPKGVRHQPYAAQECCVVLIEQAHMGGWFQLKRSISCVKPSLPPPLP